MNTKSSKMIEISNKYKIPYTELVILLKNYDKIHDDLICGVYENAEDLFISEIEPNLIIPSVLVGAIKFEEVADNYMEHDESIFRLKDGRILSLNY